MDAHSGTGNMDGTVAQVHVFTVHQDCGNGKDTKCVMPGQVHLHNNVPNMQNDICELAINSMHMHLCHPQVSKGPYNLLPRPLE